MKFITHIGRRMGVGTNGQKFSSQLAVTAQNVLTGIGMSQAAAEASCIALQAFSLVNQCFQYRVNVFQIFLRPVFLILIRPVAHYIVQMSIGIKTVQIPDSLQAYLEKTLIGSLLAAGFEKGRKIGVHAVNKMAGADDKVKGRCLAGLLQIFFNMPLKSQLDSNLNLNPVLIPVS